MNITSKHTLLILAFLFLGMCSCSKDSDESDIASEGKKMELQVVSSKALPGEAAFSAPVFFASGSETGLYSNIWKATVGANGRTDFSETRYYPSDDSRIYLRGFAPEGESVGISQRKYLIDGNLDILITNEQSGSLTDMFWQTGKAFEFIHLLTQLRFRFRTDGEAEEEGWKPISLTVEGLQQEAILSLVDKTLSFSGDKKSISVFNHTQNTNSDSFGTDWSDISETTLVQPGVPVSLTVVVEDAAGDQRRFDKLSVSFQEEDGTSLAGTSYLISVTLRQEDSASLNVAVAPWKIGASGGGEIEGE